MQTDSDQKIAEIIFQHTNGESELQVLEIGCGNGRISALLAGKVGELIAIDPDAECIVTAVKNISGANFQTGSGEQLCFAEGCFDLVVFTLSLHHQNSAKALAEAARVLKPAGRIMVIEPHVDGEVEKAFAFVHNENQAKLNAQQAIHTSNLCLVREEEINATWAFTDESNLLSSLFDYYQVPFDDDVAEKISTFIAHKKHQRLIVLEDRMTLQILTKETPSGVER